MFGGEGFATVEADLEEDGGGLLATHDGDAGVGPGPELAGAVGAAAHGVVSCAEAAADDDGEFGDGGTGDGGDHLGAILSDAGVFVLAADHEAGDVLEEEEGDATAGAEFDEVGALEGGFGEEDAVVGEDADGVAFDAGEAADEGGAVASFEFVEAGAIDDAGDDFADVDGVAEVGGDDAEEVVAGVSGGFWLGDGPGWWGRGREGADDVADDAEGVVVVVGEVVGDAGDAGVDVGAAELFGGGDLAGGGSDEWWAAEEDGAGAADDDGFVAHGGDVGAAGGARAHDGGNLGDAEGAHARLVVEDAAEVVFIGKDVVLEWEEGAAGIDEVDAGEVVLFGDFLGAEVFFDGEGVVGAALDGGVVGDDDAGVAGDEADAGDDAGGWDVIVVDAIGGEGAEFEEGGCGVEEELDALAGEEFAAGAVAFDGGGVAAGSDAVEACAQFGEKGCVVGGIGAAGLAGGVEAGFEAR